MREVFFGRKRAEKDFARLDSFTQKRVARIIEEIRLRPESGTPLTGDLAGYCKYRFGKFRAIYSYDVEKVTIVAIDTRADVYDELKRYIEEVSKMSVSPEPTNSSLKSD